MTSILDRKRGALIGLAVGDALGAAVEFRARDTFPPVTGYRGGGPHGLGPGEWTDDTSMALAMAAALRDGFDLVAMARNWLAWCREGAWSVDGTCFDIGSTTLEGLEQFARTEDPETSGPRRERASGNGSIMRLAPVVIAHHAEDAAGLAKLAELAARTSLPTHGSPLCTASCAYLALLLAGLIGGVPWEQVSAPDWEPVAAHLRAWPEPVRRVAAGSWRGLPREEVRSDGFVLSTLEASLWAMEEAAGFDEAVLRAVNLGDDADTTGAVCGQLAGARWGESGIGEDLRTGLAGGEMIEQALAAIGAGG